jgi:membrane associated rhomboid family serine protease
MGIYDRDYSRDSEPGFQLSAPTTATMQLLLITVAVYVLQMLSEDVTPLLALKSDWWRRPWEVYTLLTYGFAHSLGGPGQPGVWHIVGNMFALWMFGSEVERHYGKTKFTAFYLTAIIVSGLFWTLCEDAAGTHGTVIGASGATTALVILFALNYPNLDILFMFAIPMKMWVLGAIVVASDVWGTMQQEGEVAFTVHLGGAAYAWLYYKTGWSPALWLFDSAKNITRNRPKLRVHAPEEDEEDSLNQQVDRILEKIQRQGQDSLTWKERRTLERASKQYQEKRK